MSTWVPSTSPGDGDRLVVDGRLRRVQVGDELRDAAVELELVRLVRALVVNRDRQAAVQVRQLAQALAQHLEAELGPLEDLRVGLERDLRAGPLGDADGRQLRRRIAAPVLLVVGLAVALDLELQPLGQRVDDRHADAVQTARDLVARVIELAARVQHGHHDLGGGSLLDRVLADGDAAAVVLDRDRAVEVDDDVDAIAEAGERLVDGVVDDLVDHVVQARAVIGVADVHARPLAHRLQALQDLDALFVVTVAAGSTALGAGVSGRLFSPAAGGSDVVMSESFARGSQLGNGGAERLQTQRFQLSSMSKGVCKVKPLLCSRHRCSADHPATHLEIDAIAPARDQVTLGHRDQRLAIESARRSRKSSARRWGSSSLGTSSSSSTGGSPSRSPISVSSASFSASTSDRSCPCDAWLRARRPPRPISRSSVCGPKPVKRRARPGPPLAPGRAPARRAPPPRRAPPRPPGDCGTAARPACPRAAPGKAPPSGAPAPRPARAAASPPARPCAPAPRRRCRATSHPASRAEERVAAPQHLLERLSLAVVAAFHVEHRQVDEPPPRRRRRPRQQQVLGHEQHDAAAAPAPPPRCEPACRPGAPSGRRRPPPAPAGAAGSPGRSRPAAAPARRRAPRWTRSSAWRRAERSQRRQVVHRLDDVGLALAVVARQHGQALAQGQEQRREVPPPSAASSRMRMGQPRTATSRPAPRALTAASA